MPFDFHNLPDHPEDLDRFIRQYEEGITGLKAGARATVVWASPDNKSQTEYALVYLHGFKASYGEGEPIHRRIAQYFGFNLYLARLYKHGIDNPDAFSHLTADHFTDSARQALCIGQKLGKKVIVMGTSTGGSLGLYLASLPSYRNAIACLILYSPLIRFYGLRNIFLATRPGRALLRIAPGKRYMITSPFTSDAEEAIWYRSYRLQGALALGNFIQQTMHKETFSSVQCPVFTGYYYRNRSEQDKIVSVSAIRKMHHQLGTPERSKKLVNFPDAQTHVISSQLLSDSIRDIEERTRHFLQNILGLMPL